MKIKRYISQLKSSFSLFLLYSFLAFLLITKILLFISSKFILVWFHWWGSQLACLAFECHSNASMAAFRISLGHCSDPVQMAVCTCYTSCPDGVQSRRKKKEKIRMAFSGIKPGASSTLITDFDIELQWMMLEVLENKDTWRMNV